MRRGERGSGGLNFVVLGALKDGKNVRGRIGKEGASGWIPQRKHLDKSSAGAN